MLFFWSIVFIFVFTVLFILGNHYKLKKQYEKKKHEDEKLYRQVEDKIKQFPFTENTDIRILLNGEEKFPTLFQDIKEAQESIHLLYYTLRDDQIGTDLQRLLIERAAKGVKIRLLVDGVGSKELSKESIMKLKDAGIDVGVFAPPSFAFLFHINYRNHRKVVVIDGKIGYTGGLNVGDEYLHKDAKHGYWRDVHVRTVGESALLLQRIFARDWYYTTNLKISEDDQLFPSLPIQDGVLAKVIPSGPDMAKPLIKQVYLEMISNAKERIWISTPYFVPDQEMMKALKEARKKGVEICLLVPKKTDNLLVQAASYHYFQSLLKHGVNIYLYNKGFYHAKMILVDQEIGKIGSANFDQRSFYYSFESGLLFHNEIICKKMEQIFIADFKDCTLLEVKQIRKRSIWERTMTQFSLLLAPWL
jgi:cardiolipin synthase